MRRDKVGQQIYTENDLCDLFMQDHRRVLDHALVETAVSFDQLDLINIPNIVSYIPVDSTIEEFDKKNQLSMFIPDEYVDFDIVKWVIEQCKNNQELDRVSKELTMFADRDMIPLLRYLKYFVDTMRKHKILWGVGRGSSVASFVLYLIGVHRINSILFDLEVEEFLK
jgi:DNA polymerase III alpha subunit